MTRHFLRDDDLTPAKQHEIIQRARYLKGKRDGYAPFAQGDIATVLDEVFHIENEDGRPCSASSRESVSVRSTQKETP